MPQTLICPQCKQRYPWNPQIAGNRVRCKQCRHAFVAPAKPEPEGGYPARGDREAAPTVGPSAARGPAEADSGPGGSLLDEELGPLDSGGVGSIDDLLDETLSSTLEAPTGDGGPLGPPRGSWRSGFFAFLHFDALNLRSSDSKLLFWGAALVAIGLAIIVVPGLLVLIGYGMTLSPLALSMMAMSTAACGMLCVLYALRQKPQVAMPLVGGVALLMVLCYSLSPATNPADESTSRTDQPAEADDASEASNASGPKAPGPPGAVLPAAPDVGRLSPEEAAAYNKLVSDFSPNQIARVVVRPLREDLFEYTCKRVYKLTGAERYFGTAAEKETTIWIAPIDDLQKAAAAIDFGTVETDPQARAIFVQTDPAALPQPLKPEVDDPDDPLFYRRNLEDLTCYDPQRRRLAMARLRNAPERELHEAIVNALVSNLDHEDAELRADALKTLAEWYRDEAIESIVARVDDEDEAVRTAALQALLKSDDPIAYEAAASRLGTDSVAAINVLIEMGPDAEDAVLGQLNAEEPRTKIDACAVLERIGGEKSHGALKELVAGGTDDVAEAASKALEATGGTSAEQMLATAEGVLLFLRGSTARQEQALAALSELEPDPAYRDDIAKLLAERAADDSLATSQRMATIKALGRWQTPETASALVALCKSKEAVIRRAALRAIGGLRTQQAVEAATAMFPDEPFLAFKALEQMGANAEEIVVQYLGSENRSARIVALDVLEQHGTRDSLQALRALLRRDDLSARVKEVIHAIQQRMK